MRPTWRRLREEVDLTGASLVASSALVDRTDGPADLLLHLPDGDSVQVRLRTSDAFALTRLLAAGAPRATAAREPAPVRRRPARGTAAIAVVVSGLVYVGFYVLMAATGYATTATVTAGDGDGDGFCAVVWEDDAGRRYSGESGCSDESAGSTVDVLVSGWPFPDEAITPGDFALETLVVGIPLCGLGGVRLLFVRRRAARWRRDLASAPGTAQPLPRAAEAAATNWALTRSRRRTMGLFAVGILSLTGFVVSASVVFDESAELRASGEQAVGTVDEIRPTRGLTTGSAVIRYRVDGAERSATVSLGEYTDQYSEGQTVTVHYDAADPGRMTIDDQDNQPSWSVLPMIVALVGGAAIVWLAGHRWVRELRVERLLWDQPWERVRAESASHGGLVVRLDDDSVWRSERWSRWRRREQDEDLPTTGDEEDDAGDRYFWRVSDGTRSVFAPDRSGPFVLTRRSR